MQIQSLEIINWGRHKKLHAKTPASVIGLLGANGAGKSTIIEAIRFAFTGVLPGKAETWVRNYGAPNGAKNGSVRIHFVKDGKHGCIFRQVGATAKREFTWDGGKPLTAAKAVDELLEEVFGANKHAIGTVVFVRQGELDKLMFGTDTERAELYLKMLLLDFMPRRAELVRQKIESIMAGVTDYSALRDELRSQMTEAAKEHTALQSELESTPDRSMDLRELEAFVYQAAETDKLNAELAVASSDLRDKSASIHAQRSLVQAALESTEIAQASRYLSDIPDSAITVEMAEQLDLPLKFERALSAHNELWTRFQLAGGVVAQLNRNKAEVEEASTLAGLEELRLQLRTAEADKLPAVAHLTERLSRCSERNKLREHLLVAEKALEDADAKLRAKHDELASYATRKEDAGQAVVDATTAYKLAAMTHDVLKRMYDHTTTAGSHVEACPICKGTSAIHITSEDVQAAKQAETTAFATLHKAELTLKTICDLHDSIRIMSSTVENHAAEVDAIATKLRELGDSDDTVESVNGLLEATRKASTAVIESQVALAELTRRKTAAEKWLSAVSAGDMALVEWYGTCTESEPDLELKSNTLRRAMNTIGPVMSVYRSLKDTVAETQSKIDVLTANLRESTTNVYNRAKELNVDMLDIQGLQNRLDELRAYLKNRDGLQGRVVQAGRNMSTILEKQKDVERRIDQNAKRLALVEKLRQLKETLSRGGLPAAVLEQQFGLLVDAVQIHLADMGANFTIAADSERPTSFCFTRTDEEEPYVMSQDKLSGGQKVRLTLALLLAIQQLIIPEVGFLVLDEPSVHLDDAGVESLRELLQTLQPRLGSTGAQVVVCDHDIRLESAFGATIKV